MRQDIKQASDVTAESLLQHLANSHVSGCLQVSCQAFSSVSFFLYFWEGNLCYATNTIAPFERLERHLRRLNNQNPQLNNQTIKKVRQKVGGCIDINKENPLDYQGISWLVSEQKYLQPQEILTLLKRLIREVIEALLCLPKPLIYKFIVQAKPLTTLASFDVQSSVRQCHKRLQSWQFFTTHVRSTYERLYLTSEVNNSIPNLTAEQNQTLCRLLKGLNFRQISALIDKDELTVAKLLYPAIIDGNIIIRSPKQPFDKLPNLPIDNLFANVAVEPEKWSISRDNADKKLGEKDTEQPTKRRWKVACVDHSIATHNKIQNILSDNTCVFKKITEPMNAMAELLEFKPEIILLEREMPQINGYELCSLLRKHQEFKSVPIIILTEEGGLANLTKSKLVGATDCLVKPLEESKLSNLLFKYVK